MALDPPVAPPPGMEDLQHYDMARDIGQKVEALILDVTGMSSGHYLYIKDFISI